MGIMPLKALAKRHECGLPANGKKECVTSRKLAGNKPAFCTHLNALAMDSCREKPSQQRLADRVSSSPMVNNVTQRRATLPRFLGQNRTHHASYWLSLIGL